MARIGDTVDPRLLRADTSGILRGSAAGAAAMGQGLANLGASLGQAAQTIGANKNAVKDGKEMAKAMLQLHGAESEIGKVLTPVVDAFDSEELRFSEKLGLARRLTPLIGAATQKQAQDIAALTRSEAERVTNRKLAQTDRALNLEEQKLDDAKLAAIARAGAQGQGMTVAQEALEKATAADMTEWGSGGDATAQNQVNSLDNILAQFGDQSVPLEERLKLKDKTGGNIRTGRLQGLTRGGVGYAVFGGEKTRKTRKAKQDLYKIIVGTLKQTLGAQFTEKEAERILGLYWDDFSTEEINFQKVQDLRTYLQSQIDAKNKLQQNFEATGFYHPQAGTMPAPGATPGEAPGATPGAAPPATSSRLGGFRQRREGATEPAVPVAPATPASASQQEFNPSAFKDLSPEEQEAHRERKRQRIAGRAPVALLVPPGQAQAVIEPGRVRQPRGAQPVAPTQKLPTGPDLIEGPGGVLYENIDPPIGPSFLRKVPQAEVSVEGAGKADPVKAVPLPEPQASTATGQRKLARGAGSATKIPAEIKTATRILTAKLPRATSALAQQMQHDNSAKLRVLPEFSPPALADRQTLRKQGFTLLNLDSNHSGFKADGKTPKRRVLDPMMILPDDATEQDKVRARMAVELMDELYDSVHGKMPQSSPTSRVLTRSQNNNRGRKGVTHTELFAVTDNKMVNFLKTVEGAKEYASILRTAYGDSDKVKFYLPHSQSAPGAKTDKGSTEADLALHIMKYL